jgi:hypothetical protein
MIMLCQSGELDGDEAPMDGDRMDAIETGGAGRWRRADRGEIQGWVFVTVMTAGLVFAIWTLAEDQLSRLFQQALSSVTGG